MGTIERTPPGKGFGLGHGMFDLYNTGPDLSEQTAQEEGVRADQPATFFLVGSFVKEASVNWIDRLLVWIFGHEIPSPIPIPQPDPVPDPDPVRDDSTEEFLQYLNPDRANAGHAPLFRDDNLVKSAKSWSDYQAKFRVMQHGDISSRIGHIYPNRFMGEDVAAGQVDVKSVYHAWKEDSPHDAIMMGNYTICGLVYATDTNGFRYWTLDLVR